MDYDVVRRQKRIFVPFKNLYLYQSKILKYQSKVASKKSGKKQQTAHINYLNIRCKYGNVEENEYYNNFNEFFKHIENTELDNADTYVTIRLLVGKKKKKVITSHLYEIFVAYYSKTIESMTQTGTDYYDE